MAGFSSGPLDFRLVPIRKLALTNNDDLRDIELEPIFTYLLDFMSRYGGLGAKVKQGWGQFCLNDIDETMLERGRRALCKLASASILNGGHEKSQLPNAQDFFVAVWTVPDGEKSLNLDWGGKLSGTSPYHAAGFAIRYRFRRYIKFFEVDNCISIPGLTDPLWRTTPHGNPWSRVPWKEAILITRALFGRDNANRDTDRQSGVLGVSHVYKVGNAWRIKLFGRLPRDSYYYRTSNNALRWDTDQLRPFLICAFERMLKETGAPGIVLQSTETFADSLTAGGHP